MPCNNPVSGLIYDPNFDSGVTFWATSSWTSGDLYGTPTGNAWAPGGEYSGDMSTFIYLLDEPWATLKIEGRLLVTIEFDLARRPGAAGIQPLTAVVVSQTGLQYASQQFGAVSAGFKHVTMDVFPPPDTSFLSLVFHGHKVVVDNIVVNLCDRPSSKLLAMVAAPHSATFISRNL